MQTVEDIQIVSEKETGNGIAGADGQSTQQKLLRLREFIFPGSDQAQCAADILVEHLTFSGQRNAAGTAGKQTGLQRSFQLFDRLADGGLRDIEIFRCHGNIAAVGNLFKHAV